MHLHPTCFSFIHPSSKLTVNVSRLEQLGECGKLTRLTFQLGPNAIYQEADRTHVFKSSVFSINRTEKTRVILHLREGTRPCKRTNPNTTDILKFAFNTNF